MTSLSVLVPVYTDHIVAELGQPPTDGPADGSGAEHGDPQVLHVEDGRTSTALEVKTAGRSE